MKREEYLKELKNCIQALPIEEQNEADALIANPQQPYTQRLIDAIPKGI